ncbi:MAG: AraC family transcriptional regulator, partial [Gemmatimonadota bacterium]
MPSLNVATAPTFSIFAPPYDRLVPCSPETIDELTDLDRWKGTAIVWHLTPAARQNDEFDALRRKAPGLPLLVLLPPPTEISRITDMLPLVRLLSPRMILPHGLLDSIYRLRQVFAMPPRSLPGAVTDYLIRRGLLNERKAVREFQRILELAPDTRSIAALSRRMYTSRRTLGRHFVATGMPVPSHCLHFGRLLHVTVQLQVDDAAMFRVATRFGYPDGFTMSNQMKRLIGYRPSQVRDLLGWEWVVEAWLRQEGV